MDRQRRHNLEMAALKLDYEKMERLLHFTQEKLYCEEGRAEALRAKLDSLRSSLALVYPNSLCYMVNRESEDVKLQLKKL